jgi:hypothetical protein
MLMPPSNDDEELGAAAYETKAAAERAPGRLSKHPEVHLIRTRSAPDFRG